MGAAQRLFESPALSTGEQVTTRAFELTPTPSYSGVTSVHTSVTSTTSQGFPHILVRVLRGLVPREPI